MAFNGNDKVIGFSLDDSLLIDYESEMHSTRMRTDIIALEDSEVIVIPAKIFRERLNEDHELNMYLMLGLLSNCIISSWNLVTKPLHNGISDCLTAILG